MDLSNPQECDTGAFYHALAQWVALLLVWGLPLVG